MSEAEYVADFILKGGDKEDFCGRRSTVDREIQPVQDFVESAARSSPFERIACTLLDGMLV